MQNEFDYKKYLALIAAKKRLFAAVALVIMTAGVVFCYFLPKRYEAKSTVFVEKNVITELVKGIAVTPSMDQAIKVLTYAITSRTLVQKVVSDLDMDTRVKNDAQMEAMYKEIQKNINVKVKDNNLFIISYTDQDPRIARDFVNTLVRRYIEDNVSSKREESYGAIKFLSEQLDTLKERLDQSDRELTQYKAQKGGIISIDEGKLFQEINTAQQKLYDIQLRRRHLEGLRPLSRKAGDPLQTKLVMLQKSLEELRVQYTDSYPEVVKVKTEIAELKEQMKGRKGDDIPVADPQELEKVEAELHALKASEEGLKRYIATNQSLLRTIPTAKAGMEELELEKKNRKDLYDQLMSRHGQSEVSKQMEIQDKTTNFRIVDPAIMPVKPVSPDRVKIIFMAIVAGLAGAFGLIIGLDYLDHSVKDVDVVKSLGFPVLAVIPRIRNDEQERQERRRDFLLYQVAGCYFMLILGVLVSEVLNYSIVDKIVSKVTGG